MQLCALAVSYGLDSDHIITKMWPVSVLSVMGKCKLWFSLRAYTHIDLSWQRINLVLCSLGFGLENL